MVLPVPSMLIVVPSGSMKRITRGSILLPDSKQRIVHGNVAVLEAVPSAQMSAWSIFLANVSGFLLVKM